MAANRLYQKLPGNGRKFISAMIYQLYLGPDHLLKVESTRVTEKYRRFYFSDIQGFSVQKTRKSAIASIVLATMGILLSAGAVAARETPEGLYPLAIAAGLFLSFALVNTLFGPTCRTHLFTAVSNEELPSLNRLRRTRKVLARLTPLIEQAQGGRLEPERYEMGAEPFVSSLPPPGRPGWIVTLFFTVILGLAAALSFDLMLDQMAITFVILALMLGGIVLCVVSLIQAYQRRLRKGLTVTCWLGGAFCGVILMLHYALAVYVQVKNLAQVGTNLDSLRQLSAISAQDHAWLAAILLALAVIGFVVGGLGIFFTRPSRFAERAAA